MARETNKRSFCTCQNPSGVFGPNLSEKTGTTKVLDASRTDELRDGAGGQPVKGGISRHKSLISSGLVEPFSVGPCSNRFSDPTVKALFQLRKPVTNFERYAGRAVNLTANICRAVPSRRLSSRASTES